MKYVSGEKRAITLPHKGISFKGMKIPLINIIGNLISVEIIIIFAGVSVGGVESKDPSAEKQNDASNIPAIIRWGKCIEIPPNIPTKSGTMEIIIPNKKEARISPVIIVEIDTGEETNLSRVLVLVSQGAISGTTAVEVKKRVIPTIPGKRKVKERFLPIQKARNRKQGNRIPNIKTGALK